MDILSQYENAVESLWVRHESRYEVMTDFSSAHLNFLKPTAIGQTRSQHDAGHLLGARSYVSSRSLFRKDMTSMQLCLQCGIDLHKTFNRKRKRQDNGDAENDNGDEDEDCSRNSLKLAANLCTFQAFKYKTNLYKSHLNVTYHHLLIQLDRYIEHIVSDYPDICDYTYTNGGNGNGNGNDNENIEFPLHNYGKITSENKNNNMNINGNGQDCKINIGSSLFVADSAEQDRRDALIELLLVKKLQKNVRDSSSLMSYLESNVIPLVLKKE
jgi:hypothetical protein